VPGIATDVTIDRIAVPFRTITGHRRTLAFLTRSVVIGSLPPSLIFAGTRGVGKRAAAIALAQTLNCAAPLRDVRLPDGETNLAIDACGECPSCRRIERGIHPDVLVLGPDVDTGNIRIDEVRALTERIGYRPFEARWRVVVVESADALLDAAQNALLKTLEEPPSSSIFVLVTSRPDDLLPTVRSRCPLIRFAPLSIDEVARVLERHHGVAQGDAQALAAVSGGSVGAALETGTANLADARIAAERLLAQLAGQPDARARLDATSHLASKGAKGSSAGEREWLATHLRAVQSLLRDIGVLSTSPGGPVSNIDLKPALLGLAPAFSPGRLVAAFAALDRALIALDSNASPKIVADWVVLQI
jgi:DNA polymerase-3 subunit delta'